MGGGEGGLKERGRNKLLLLRLGGERAYLRGGGGELNRGFPVFI